MTTPAELVKRLKSKKAATGEIVLTTDGRVLFLTAQELKRATVRRRDHAPIRKLRSRRSQPASPRRAAGCRGIIRWLLTHDPHSRFWRQVYVDWVNNC